MPRGRTHLIVELGTLPGWAALGASLNVGRTPLALFAAAYVAGSLLLSPDLDLARSDPSRRWQRARFLWLPYAALFRHRGLSHSLILGPLTRIAYLALLVGLVWAVLHGVAGVALPRTVPWDAIAPVLAGLYLPHLLHVGLDRAVSLGRRVLLSR